MNRKTEIQMRQSHSKDIRKALARNWQLYVLLLPMVVWFAVWMYKPMSGLLIAFKRFEPSLGVWRSEFKGFDNFHNLVSGVQKVEFWQAFRNTFIISSYSLVFGFPVPIILALFFSEMNHEGVRKIIQTITYLPHFLSEVTITSIVLMLVYNGVQSTGVIAQFFINRGWLAPDASIMSFSSERRCLMRSEVNVKVSLFQKDGISYALVLSSIIFELLFSVKILDVIAVNWLIGVSTILNIILLFLLFSCAVKVNVYKVGWAVCALSIAGYAVIRACVLLPLLLKPVSDVPGLVLDNAGLA